MARTHFRALARRRRHARVRKHISGTPERPRLAVYRSLRHLHAQIIDDTAGHTLVAASSSEPGLADQLAGKSKSEVARVVGELLGQRAVEAGITNIVFDRGGFPYHGRVKALAEGARKKGLEF